LARGIALLDTWILANVNKTQERKLKMADHRLMHIRFDKEYART